MMSKSKQVNPIKNNRLVIGLLTYHEDNDNHNQMMAGIFEAARKHDVNIIRLAGLGRDLSFKTLSYEIKNLFEIIRSQNLDGLMFLGWTPIIRMYPEEYVKYFHPMPLFSLGSCYDNIPSIYTEGSAFFRELLIHLIEVHHCRKIAYIAPVHWDMRVDVYLEVMRKFGIYDPDLLVDADILRPVENDLASRGQKAVSVLLDEKKALFDAIAVSNSDETFSVLEELRNRGIGVPDDVKVIGYEDDESSKYALTPITTIYFPFREIGFQGCERFIEMLTTRDQNLPFATHIPAKIIFRRSCGCNSGSIQSVKTEPASKRQSGPRSGKVPDPNKICDKMLKSFPKREFDPAGLLAAFFSDYHHDTSFRFAAVVQTQLMKYYRDHSDASGMEDFISELRKIMIPYVAGQTADYIWMEDLLHQARVTIAEKAVNLLGYQTVQTNRLNQMLFKISQEMITTFHTQKLMNVLESSLVRLNIPGCYLFLFDRKKETMAESALAFEYQDGWRVSLQANHQSFYLKDLRQNLPQNRRYSLLAYLLAVNDEYLGLVLFEPGPLDERIYFSLSILLSTALKGATLVEKLENTNQELTSAQQELVDKAHKAGMADIATGTLHNVGNVLNSINTSIYMMKDIIKDSPLKDLERANLMLKKNMDDLENFITHDHRGLKLMQFYLKLEAPFLDLQNLIYNHLNRLMDRINLVNEIIIAQQNYAGARPALEELDLTDVIDDALKLQAAMLDKYKIKIVKNYQIIPRTVIQRTKFLHILINLINNARDAMFETPGNERTLTITLNGDANNIYLGVRDTGRGISPELLQSIFTQGFAAQHEGHGYELRSCINYMEEMGGNIWAESSGIGKGATFILQFPRSGR
jgi:DNA-binding LacI/PurR family transcriptional regulator/signal transduction histidine kinase